VEKRNAERWPSQGCGKNEKKVGRRMAVAKRLLTHELGRGKGNRTLEGGVFLIAEVEGSSHGRTYVDTRNINARGNGLGEKTAGRESDKSAREIWSSGIKDKLPSVESGKRKANHRGAGSAWGARGQKSC